MARVKYQRTAVDGAGNGTASTQVEVRDLAGDLATLYENQTGSTQAYSGSNPFNSGDGDPDDEGFFEFWVEEGTYTVEIGSGASAKTYREELHPAYTTYKNVTTLLASTESIPEGTVVRTDEEGFAYEVAASGASDEHLTTAGGVKLKVLPGDYGWNVKAFGAKGDGSTDDQGAIQIAIDCVSSNGGGLLFFPEGRYKTLDRVFCKSGVFMVGAGKASVIDNQSSEPGGKTFAVSFGDIHERDWQNQPFDEATWVAGNTKVETVTPADAGNYSVGQPIFLYRGFPSFVSGGIPLADNAIYAQIVRVRGVNAGSGAITVDVELQTSEDEKTSDVYPNYDAGTTYAQGDIVWHAGTSAYYVSLVNSNTGNTPSGATDANWGIETRAVTDLSGTSQLDGRTTYIMDGGGMMNMAIRTNSSQWMSRACNFECVWDNIYIEEADTLFGGNGYNRAVVRNIQGVFRRGAIELGEATFDIDIANIRGTMLDTSAQGPKDELINMNMPLSRLRDFHFHCGSHTFGQAIRIGGKTEDFPSEARDGVIYGGIASALVDLRTDAGRVDNVKFIGRSSTPNQFVLASNPSKKSAVVNCMSQGHDFGNFIINAPNGRTPDVKIDYFDFSFNKIYGTARGNFRVQGSHGRIVGNFIDLIGAPIVSDSSDFATWEVERNTRDDGDYWDNIYRGESTNNDRFGLWYSRDVTLNIGAPITYTMPDPGLCPSGRYIHTIRNTTNVTADVTVEPFGSETFFVERGNTAATTFALAPGVTRQFLLDRATGNWVIL